MVLRLQSRARKSSIFIYKFQVFPSTRFKWFNRSIRTNPEQMQAIKYIVNGYAKPAPYILFGPPGTGKTSTVVEAICQLYTVEESLKILVTAQSNAACDVIADRLLKFLPSTDIYRLFAPSWEKKQDKVAKELLQISNLASGRHAYPGWSTFFEYRVVVCTLTTAGRLVQAHIRANHFTHVFIDECASATEPSALIPIVGLVTTARRINAHVVLSGDIKQLGPVIKNKMAEKMGYGTPLMERLMQRPLYQKDPATNAYNPLVITKLVQNFRSHTKIIEFSNRAFYENDLVAKARPEMTDWALGWKLLPNPKFPAMLLPCYGHTKREKNCYSSYNVEEIDTIMNCLRLLLTDGVNGKKIRPSDIGIISPYRRQCSKLMMRLRDYCWDGVEVGTVETYQGREKPVIVISTVRSKTKCIGFLNNPKVS
jgi:helicase MOV-10